MSHFRVRGYTMIPRHLEPLAPIWKYTALPTWLVIMATWHAYPKTHPWYGRPRFTLMHWYAHETKLSRQYDFLLWFIGALLILTSICFYYLIHQ